jgi:DNA-binding NarL/FixJ family response regulator
MKLGLIDAQPDRRSTLAAAIREVWGDLDVIEAPSLASFVSSAPEIAADIVLTHLGPDRLADFATLASLADQLSPARIVLLSERPERHPTEQAIKAGISAVLDGAMPADAIGAALRLVLAGWSCFPSASLKFTADLMLQLTARESEVLARLDLGQSNKAIARDMHLSLAVVKLDVQTILRATRARNRIEAITLARRRGWLADHD